MTEPLEHHPDSTDLTEPLGDHFREDLAGGELAVRAGGILHASAHVVRQDAVLEQEVVFLQAPLVREVVGGDGQAGRRG